MTDTESIIPEDELSEEQTDTEPAGDGEGAPSKKTDGTYTAEDMAEELPDFASELSELSREMPELATGDEGRYSELRAMGLTPREAYLATSHPRVRADNRSHLRDSTPTSARSPYSGISRQALESARALFEDMGDAEIQRLYKRVTR